MSSQGSCNYKDVLKILEEDNILIKKLDYFKIMASKCIPSIPYSDLETEILSHLMPHVNEMLLSIFEEVIEIACDNTEQQCSQTLTVLKEKLQMAINLLQILGDILDYVTKEPKIDLLNIQSLPLYFCKMLYSTLLHCKESKNLYDIYFESLDEVLTMFRVAQELHVKLLKLLNSHLVFNCLLEDELLILNQVLVCLVDIGGVLQGMNIKSMADNWKAYIALTQKHANYLRPDFNIRHPLIFITRDIISNLGTVVGEKSDDKTLNNTIKVTNFLLKVMLKLCEMFWENLKSCNDQIWDFLISFYSVSLSHLSFKDVSENLIDSIRVQLFDVLESFLTKLCTDKSFYHRANFNDRVVDGVPVFGFVVVLSSLFEKLLLSDQFVYLDNEIDLPYLLEVLFFAVSKSNVEMTSNINAYPKLITAMSGFILMSSRSYADVEKILYKNLLTDNIWNCLTAADIWLSILRCSPNCQFSTMCNVVDQCDELLKINFTERSELVLFSFLRQLYQIQSEAHKIKFQEKYPMESNIHIWSCIGFDRVPKIYNVKIGHLLVSLTGKMEKYDAGKASFEDFSFMCTCMDAVSTLRFEEIFLDLNQLSLCTMRLWDFDASDSRLTEQNLFKFFFGSLCNLTRSLVWKWNNVQLLQILQQLKVLVNKSSYFQLLILQQLNCLSNKLMQNTCEYSAVISSTSELFNVLLNDKNSIIKLHALKIFTNFVNNTAHDEIEIDSINNSKSLQEVVAKFTKKSCAYDANGGILFLKSLQDVRFRHKCLKWSSALPKTKKVKVENKEATAVLQRIKKDVSYLSEIGCREDLTCENVSDVSYVLKKLEQFV